MYDQGEDDGLVYLVMEFVPGRTVRDVLRQYGRLSAEQALTIIDPVLQALEAAHRAGFVHRDVKPENVLLTDDGRVKVAAVGLARAISAATSTAATQGAALPGAGWKRQCQPQPKQGQGVGTCATAGPPSG